MARGVAVLTFPGSNGDMDAFHAFRDNLSVPAELVDYRATSLDGFEAVVLPGGFSYGDYLRCGAIARFSPVMDALKSFAERGGPVLGICNGFQILIEAHLLPGALLMNQSLEFRSEWLHVRVESGETPWTASLTEGEVLNLPVAHGGGNYFADPKTIDRLIHHGQIIFRYCSYGGETGPSINFNGSTDNIAGICNERRNVVGLMPHPERASDPLLGPTDGRRMLSSIESFLELPV
jgi:phosphoribosylformylglycinamidine synthase